MRREYRIAKTGQTIGSIMVDEDGTPYFEGAATEILRDSRRKLGDAAVARQILAEGWSNGYVYFAEATP